MLQIKREKEFEASQKIGVNRLTNMRRTRGKGEAAKTQNSAIEKEVVESSKEETPNVISQMFS